MTDKRHQRQPTVIPTHLTLPVHELSDPSPAPIEDTPPSLHQRYYSGSVFSLAKKLGHEEADDSSVLSGGVEVIVSELENLTQVSDCSLQLSARECNETDQVGAGEERRSVKAAQDVTCLRQAERSIERKEVLSQALAPVRPGPKQPRPDNEIPVKAAIMRLISDKSTREAAIRSVSKAQCRHLYLLLAQGKIQGLYGLDRTALRKLFGGLSRGEVVTFSSVKRWLRLEGLGFRAIFGYQYRHADAFEL